MSRVKVNKIEARSGNNVAMENALQMVASIVLLLKNLPQQILNHPSLE